MHPYLLLPAVVFFTACQHGAAVIADGSADGSGEPVVVEGPEDAVITEDVVEASAAEGSGDVVEGSGEGSGDLP